MGQFNIKEEIDKLVQNGTIPGMSAEECQALREKITNKVLEERAELAKLCPEEVKEMWGKAKELGHHFDDILHKLKL